MRGDRLLAEPVAQMAREPLGHAPRVDEHQGGAMRGGELGDAVVDALPDVVGHHRFERDRRQFEREVALADVAHIDDRAGARVEGLRERWRGRCGRCRRCIGGCRGGCLGPAPLRGRRLGGFGCSGGFGWFRRCRGFRRLGNGGRFPRFGRFLRSRRVGRVGRLAAGRAVRGAGLDAHQEPGHQLDRLLRGRQPDARQRPARQRVEPLQRQGEMAAALVAGQRVDLVDDGGSHRRQHASPRFRGEQHVQRFGRGHQDVRGAFAQRAALGLGGVAGAHGGADLGHRQAEPGEFVRDAGQRRLEIDADVVGQRLERRDIDHQGLVGQAAVVVERLAHQLVDRAEEGGEGLARAGRRGHQGRAAGLDERPGACLRLGRRGEAAREPAGHGRVEGIERGGRRGRGRAGGAIHQAGPGPDRGGRGAGAPPARRAAGRRSENIKFARAAARLPGAGSERGRSRRWQAPARAGRVVMGVKMGAQRGFASLPRILCAARREFDRPCLRVSSRGLLAGASLRPRAGGAAPTAPARRTTRTIPTAN